MYCFYKFGGFFLKKVLHNLTTVEFLIYFLAKKYLKKNCVGP